MKRFHFILTTFLSTTSLLISTTAMASDSQPIYSEDLNHQSIASSQNLVGIEPRNSTEWGWQVGGEYIGLTQTSPTSTFEDTVNPYWVKTEKLNLSLESRDANLGDNSRITRRFLLTDL